MRFEMVDANLPDEEYHANLPQPRGRMRGGDGVLEPQPATAYFTGSSDSARDAATSGEFLNYSAIWRKLWRRKLVVAAIFLLGTGAAAALVLRMPVYYVAHAFVVIGDPYSKPLPSYVAPQGGGQGYLPDTSAVQTEVEVIKSPQLAIEVIRDLKLQNNPDFNPRAAPGQFGIVGWAKGWLPRSWTTDWLADPSAAADVRADAAVELSQTIDNFLGRLRVSIKQNSRMVDIAFESSDPRLAMQIANAMADRYVTNQLELRLRSAQQISVWLKQRVGKLQAKVEDAERAVEEFRAQARLFATPGPGGTPLLLKQMTDVSAELANAQTARAAIEARLSQLRAPNQGKGRPNTTTDIIESPTMKALDTQEADAQQKLGEALATLGERHPTTIGLRERLRFVQSAKHTEATRIATSVENDLKIAQMKERDLSDRLARLQRDVVDMNHAEVKLRALEREAQADRLVLNNIIGRFKEVGQEGDIAAQKPDVQIVSYAQLPVSPDRPKKGLLIIIAGVASLIGGAFLALMVERADRSLHSIAEVEDVLGVKALGMLPVSKGAQLAPSEAARYGSSYREAAKAAYSRLFCVAKAPKVTVVTSALPDEGKTTLALGLAAMAAQGGQRVLFIDADFWKKGAGATFGIRSRAGLAELLEGRAKLVDAITSDVASGADIILAGTFSRASLLAWSPRLPALLAQLRNQYDIIIIDGPPILSVSEAVLIAGHADATAMAIRWASTPRDAVKTALKRLHDAGATLAGAILTLVRENQHAYYGDSAYHYQSLADCRSPVAITAADGQYRSDGNGTSNENGSSRRALLVIDAQDRLTGLSKRHLPSPAACDQLVETINRLSEVASNCGIMVISAERGHRKFLRLLTKNSERNRGPASSSDQRLRMASQYSFVRSGGDAFSNTDLHEVLRRYHIGHLFLAGLDGATTVAQTARSALDLGYRVTFVQDGIFSAFERRWQRLLMDFESAAAFAITSEEFAELAEGIKKAREIGLHAHADTGANVGAKDIHPAARRRQIASLAAVLIVGALAGWQLNRDAATGPLKSRDVWATQADNREGQRRDNAKSLTTDPAMPRRDEMPAMPSRKAEAANQTQHGGERSASQLPPASQQARDKPEMPPSDLVAAKPPIAPAREDEIRAARELQTTQQQERERTEGPTQDLAALRGLTGNEVRDLQSRLKGAGFDPGPIDGILGPRTSQAAHRYTQARSFGEAGPSKDLLARLRAEPVQPGELGH
jgi:capsular exopolysaccharide synthesis family protein